MAHGPGDPHVLEPGHAPTPFTAEEIRCGCPEGRTIRLRVENAGKPPVLRVNRFVRCDDDGAIIENAMLSLDGTPLGEPTSGASSWVELQGHASFPADQTAIESETLATEIGELDCLRYTVGDAATRRTFWFATDRPGMPIRFTIQENGRLVTTVSIVADTMR